MIRTGAPDLGEVFRRHGADYVEKFGDGMLPSHRRALEDISRCRTAALGGHLWRCKRCGREHYAYHSCRNRACPKCHRRDTNLWLEKRREELLPVPYFHAVFTIPQWLRDLFRRRQKAMYGLLMQTAGSCLMDLARDPKRLGLQIGVLMVLHTWGRTLVYHPHVHCLVPAGGLSADGREWKSVSAKYLLPVEVLSPLFRGRFLALAKKRFPEILWPRKAWSEEWVVYIKPALKPEKVLRYLGRYVHRLALSDRRILEVGEDHVRFAYKRVNEKRWRSMTLKPREFIRRFLQHIPPKGFHKVRYYGLWAPGKRALLRRLQLLLTLREKSNVDDDEVALAEGDDVASQSDSDAGEVAKHACPYCGSLQLLHLKVVRRQTLRGPP